ncbi:MAG: hypothetical protein KIT33_15800 [Candidatus Kapabacteria bacterium]|nr:hypothetical protein [Ignavibacteriota bacterium]MCW5886435.1 hypothetical protein [Candidatus Kapabacteria bacterium]
MIYVIIGVILLLWGLYLVFYSLRNKRHFLWLDSNPPTDIDVLFDMKQSDTSLFDNFEAPIELSGKILDDKFLISPIKNLECVYYNSKITNYIKKPYYYYEGKRKRKGQTVSSEVEFSESKFMEFEIKTKGNNILTVLPENPKIDNLIYYKHEENLNKKLAQDTYLIRKVFEEEIVLTDTDVFIVGSLNVQDGKFVVKKPKQKNVPYIITNKSKNELLKNFKDESKKIYIGIFFVIIGLVFSFAYFIEEFK